MKSRKYRGTNGPSDEDIEYLGGKCEKCGLVDDHVVYDFHHTDPNEKEFTIGEKVASLAARNWDKVREELDKCQLLCVLCHRKHHAGENEKLFKGTSKRISEKEQIYWSGGL